MPRYCRPSGELTIRTRDCDGASCTRSCDSSTATVMSSLADVSNMVRPMASAAGASMGGTMPATISISRASCFAPSE